MIIINYLAFILIGIISLIVSVYIDLTISNDKPVITSLITTVIVALVVHAIMS